MHSYFYTQEEEEWLKNNARKFINSVGLTEEFNRKFGKTKKSLAIRSKVHHLIPNFEWGFSGGLKKGEGRTVTASPVGAERFVGGYWYVKINNVKIGKDFTTEDIRKNWVAKHRWVWERHHGEIPKGNIVVFLDGNRENFDIDNLYCAKKQVTTMMMRNGWFSDNKDVTLTALKLCELSFALKA